MWGGIFLSIQSGHSLIIKGGLHKVKKAGTFRRARMRFESGLVPSIQNQLSKKVATWSALKVYSSFILDLTTLRGVPLYHWAACAQRLGLGFPFFPYPDPLSFPCLFTFLESDSDFPITSFLVFILIRCTSEFVVAAKFSP